MKAIIIAFAQLRKQPRDFREKRLASKPEPATAGHVMLTTENSEVDPAPAFFVVRQVVPACARWEQRNPAQHDGSCSNQQQQRQ